MIKTLKSELNLRPTYDEMIGMIENQGDVTRPSIESVIDRRATLFRNNQFGSQFDNVDFLGLKKQEEDKVKNELRQAQLRKDGVEKGISTGVLAIEKGMSAGQPSVSSSGLNTPSAIEFEDAFDYQEMMDFQNNLREFREQMRQRENEASDRIIASILGDIERNRERVRLQNFEISETAKNDLSDVHSQSLPEGVPVHSMASDGASDTMPELEPIDGADEDSQEEDASPEVRELRDGGDLMNKVGLVGDFNPDNLLNNQDIKSTGLMFQLFVRDLLSDEMIELTDRLPNEQKKKQYLVSIIEGLKETKEWQQSGFAGKTVKQEAKKFREMRKAMKNKQKNTGRRFVVFFWWWHWFCYC